MTGPAGYEFGHYCTQEWTDALNEMLRDPVVDKCHDTDAIHKLLAQVAYETGYFSTVFQPADGGAGLIHMIPGNWVRNALDMEGLWPGNDYAPLVSVLGDTFFKTPAYGWRSVAAWFKRTNEVIPNCGIDLFDQPFETQTRCILSRVNNRDEAFNIVGGCLAQSGVLETMALNSDLAAIDTALNSRSHTIAIYSVTAVALAAIFAGALYGFIRRFPRKPRPEGGEYSSLTWP